jgi:hypothetical protein
MSSRLLAASLRQLDVAVAVTAPSVQRLPLCYWSFRRGGKREPRSDPLDDRPDHHHDALSHIVCPPANGIALSETVVAMAAYAAAARSANSDECWAFFRPGRNAGPGASSGPYAASAPSKGQAYRNKTATYAASRDEKYFTLVTFARESISTSDFYFQ